jgi:hypothetical protein
MKPVLLFSFLFATFVASTSASNSHTSISGGGCTIYAFGTEVWVNVYAETGQMTKGDLLWSGHLGKDEQHAIPSVPGDRIRYMYKVSADDQYRNETGAWCHDGARLTIP